MAQVGTNSKQRSMQGGITLSNSMADDIVETLEEYFRDKEDVLLAFVFGSAVSGRCTGQSDVDIAVLFSGRPDVPGVLKIWNEAADATGRTIDLVALNDASPVIRMQILRSGKLIKSASAVIYSNLFTKTVKEYDDLKHIRKEAEEHILRGRIYA